MNDKQFNKLMDEAIDKAYKSYSLRNELFIMTFHDFKIAFTFGLEYGIINYNELINEN